MNIIDYEDFDNGAEKIINQIESNKSDKLYLPFCDGLAYFECELNKEQEGNKKCFVHLGDDYFIKTSFTKAKEILQRKNKNQSEKKWDVTGYDDNTLEIREPVIEEYKPKEKEKPSKKDTNYKEILKTIEEEKDSKETVETKEEEIKRKTKEEEKKKAQEMVQKMKKEIPEIKFDFTTSNKNKNPLKVRNGKDILMDMIRERKAMKKGK